jgi:hypothetical protein
MKKTKTQWGHLTPNQKVVFVKDSRKIIPSLVEEPVVIVPPVQLTQFIFEETPLAQVLQHLKQAYMIDFEVESDAFDNCVFTGDLTNCHYIPNSTLFVKP